MKKTILTVVLTMIVMSVFGGFVICKINKKHDVEMKTVNLRHKHQIEEYAKDIKEKDETIENYENQIYNIFENKNYKVTIRRNGGTISYRKDNDTSKIGKLLGLKTERKITIK